MLIQASYLTRPMKAYQAAGEPIPILWRYLPMAAFAFIVWQMVGLIRLKPFHRWFAVVFFISWALALAWNFTVTVVIRGSLAKLFPAAAVFSVLILLNLVSAWYLSRRSLRVFAVQFVAEHEKQLMRNAAQKRMQKEISKLRK
jgi:hypothetical protein